MMLLKAELNLQPHGLLGPFNHVFDNTNIVFLLIQQHFVQFQPSLDEVSARTHKDVFGASSKTHTGLFIFME